MARVDEWRGNRLLLGVLVLAHVVVISHQVDGGGGLSLLERGVFSLLSPLQRGAGACVRGVSNAWSGYLDLRRVRDENLQLQGRVRELETALQERQSQATEAGRLRQLLGLRPILPLETLAAEVVAREGLPWYRVIVINRGSGDGVELNAPVISPTGIVGRVIERGPHAARVQLLLDRDGGVGAMIERTRVAGVVSGQVGSAEGAGTPVGELAMKYVPAAADVVENDLVVTSGSERIFPKGLAVGRVRSVGLGAGLFKEILVTPSARFDRLEEVLVLRGSTPESLLTPEKVK